MHTYVALGDSMSIDDYTGVVGGGAAKRFHAALGPGWELVDRTLDGCTMPLVPRDEAGDVLTLTIGGNDLLPQLSLYLAGDAAALGDAVLDRFARDHAELLGALRRRNPTAFVVVGNLYRPAIDLPPAVLERLAAVNARIAQNVAAVGGRLADLHAAFEGHQAEFLTLQIEPTLAGAAAVAGCFAAALGAAGPG